MGNLCNHGFRCRARSRRRMRGQEQMSCGVKIFLKWDFGFRRNREVTMQKFPPPISYCGI